MSDIYQIDASGISGRSPLKVFDGAGNLVFDANMAQISIWLTGSTSVPPTIAPWVPGSSFVSDVPHGHPSGKSQLTVVKCWGRRYLGGTIDYRGLFVRIYDINSNEGQFCTVANTFLRFGNMSYDQSPYFNNTAYFYYTMFNVSAV